MKDKQAEQLYEAFQSAISRLESRHTSIWNSSDDIAKTIISVSSVIVTFTVTFSDSIIKASEFSIWRYVICSSWSLFLSAITAAVASLWNSRRARTISVRLLKNWREFKKIISQDDPGLFEYDTKIEHWHEKTMAPIQKNTTYAECALKTSLILFALAIIVLGITGIKQIAP